MHILILYFLWILYDIFSDSVNLRCHTDGKEDSLLVYCRKKYENYSFYFLMKKFDFHVFSLFYF